MKKALKFPDLCTDKTNTYVRSVPFLAIFFKDKDLPIFVFFRATSGRLTHTLS